MTSNLFELENVSFSVAGRTLLQPLTMSIPAGSVTALIGHNGSGKSTLLKILARQQPASGGTIHLAGKRLDQWGDREFARKLAYLPQQTASASGMLVKELVALGRYPWHGALGRFGDTDRAKVEEAIELTGIAPLPTGLLIRFPVANASASGWPCSWRRMRNACFSMSRHRRSTLPISWKFCRWCASCHRKRN